MIWRRVKSRYVGRTGFWKWWIPVTKHDRTHWAGTFGLDCRNTYQQIENLFSFSRRSTNLSRPVKNKSRSFLFSIKQLLEKIKKHIHELRKFYLFIYLFTPSNRQSFIYLLMLTVHLYIGFGSVSLKKKFIKDKYPILRFIKHTRNLFKNSKLWKYLTEYW